MSDQEFAMAVVGAIAAVLLLSGLWPARRPRNRHIGLREPFHDDRSSIARHRRELAINHRSRP